jgi:23S rRNA U2552 (ribose-2'-O)-methylase RlmE/FtsJ
MHPAEEILYKYQKFLNPEGLIILSIYVAPHTRNTRKRIKKYFKVFDKTTVMSSINNMKWEIYLLMFK